MFLSNNFNGILLEFDMSSVSLNFIHSFIGCLLHHIFSYMQFILSCVCCSGERQHSAWCNLHFYLHIHNNETRLPLTFCTLFMVFPPTHTHTHSRSERENEPRQIDYCVASIDTDTGVNSISQTLLLPRAGNCNVISENTLQYPGCLSVQSNEITSGLCVGAGHPIVFTQVESYSLESGCFWVLTRRMFLLFVLICWNALLHLSSPPFNSSVWLSLFLHFFILSSFPLTLSFCLSLSFFSFLSPCRSSTS